MLWRSMSFSGFGGTGGAAILELSEGMARVNGSSMMSGGGAALD